MGKKVYYLSTCSTCQRIMQEAGVDESFEQQDVKTEPLTLDQLESLRKMADSYEGLFNRRSVKYREYGLRDKELTEADYKRYLLEEYTFLKRPVFIIDGEIFVGNSKKTVEALKAKLASFTYHSSHLVLVLFTQRLSLPGGGPA